MDEEPDKAYCQDDDSLGGGGREGALMHGQWQRRSWQSDRVQSPVLTSPEEPRVSLSQIKLSGRSMDTRPVFVVRRTNLTAPGVCFPILLRFPAGPVKPRESVQPGLAGVPAAGCPAGRAGASGSGWRTGAVPVARTEGFFLAASVGRFIGPRLLARSECELECVCKGGLQSWPGPAGFS